MKMPLICEACYSVISYRPKCFAILQGRNKILSISPQKRNIIPEKDQEPAFSLITPEHGGQNLYTRIAKKGGKGRSVKQREKIEGKRTQVQI